MRHLIVGDIHGDVNIVKYVLRTYTDTHHIVFIGDILDSFTFSSLQQIQALELVEEAVENKKATLLIGNHELSYLHPEYFLAAGYRVKVADYVQKPENRERLVSAIQGHMVIHDYLLTHAGVSLLFIQAISRDLPEQQVTLEVLPEKLDLWYHSLISPFYWIGKARGGGDPIGGPLWCDWNKEFQPIPGISQIFGHTLLPDIQIRDNNYNIDCLQNKMAFLEIDEGGKVSRIDGV